MNSGIPAEKCKVVYPDFSEAILMCLKDGKSCAIAKSDMSMAFRQVPLSRESFRFLIMKCEDPRTGQTKFFVEKCLSFGSSISCAIFQEVSNALAFLVKFRSGKLPLNYLDDYLFTAIQKLLCNSQVQQFLDICNEIGFPVAIEKTHWGTTILVFLGLLIDTGRQVILIPKEKIDKVVQLIDQIKDRKKAKVIQIQRLCGTLNFLCRCVVPGRVFLARTYALLGNPNLMQHHHVSISRETKMDLEIWKRFLSHPEIFCRPFMELFPLEATDIDMYSDASMNLKTGGFGAYCGMAWVSGKWNTTFLTQKSPSIEFLELYALTAGVLLWIKNFKNRTVNLFCDNESVKFMVNSTSSKCKNCMTLLRLLVLEGLVHNVKIRVKYVSTTDNGKADALSRQQFARFRQLGPNMNICPEEIPSSIWPIESFWID